MSAAPSWIEGPAISIATLDTKLAALLTHRRAASLLFDLRIVWQTERSHVVQAIGRRRIWNWLPGSDVVAGDSADRSAARHNAVVAVSREALLAQRLPMSRVVIRIRCHATLKL
jgi:hypothetical protein